MNKKNPLLVYKLQVIDLKKEEKALHQMSTVYKISRTLSINKIN